MVSSLIIYTRRHLGVNQIFNLYKNSWCWYFFIVSTNVLEWHLSKYQGRDSILNTVRK